MSTIRASKPAIDPGRLGHFDPTLNIHDTPKRVGSMTQPT